MDNNKKLDLLLEAVSEIKDDVKEIKKISASHDVILAVQANQLEHHIARTDVAEENIKLLREDVKPIQSHVAVFHGVLKALGAISALTGFVALVLEIIGRLS